MARPRHPNKEIEAAVAYAESQGWTFVRQGGHAWGILHCPERSRDGHQMSVHSTPSNPFTHARRIIRAADDGPH